MISLIVAFDKNQLIGANNRLPWHFKEDLKYFKQTTMNHDILMGRLTFESILSYGNKPLPGRHHIVLSKTKEYSFSEVTTINELQPFLKNYPKNKELFIIGGSSIYEQALPWADFLYITHVEGEYIGDAYFPVIDWNKWSCIRETKVGDLRFSVYKRGK